MANEQSKMKSFKNCLGIDKTLENKFDDIEKFKIDVNFNLNFSKEDEKIINKFIKWFNSYFNKDLCFKSFILKKRNIKKFKEKFEKYYNDINYIVFNYNYKYNENVNKNINGDIKKIFDNINKKIENFNKEENEKIKNIGIEVSKKFSFLELFIKKYNSLIENFFSTYKKYEDIKNKIKEKIKISNYEDNSISETYNEKMIEKFGDIFHYSKITEFVTRRVEIMLNLISNDGKIGDYFICFEEFYEKFKDLSLGIKILKKKFFYKINNEKSNYKISDEENLSVSFEDNFKLIVESINKLKKDILKGVRVKNGKILKINELIYINSDLMISLKAIPEINEKIELISNILSKNSEDSLKKKPLNELLENDDLKTNLNKLYLSIGPFLKKALDCYHMIKDAYYKKKLTARFKLWWTNKKEKIILINEKLQFLITLLKAVTLFL